LSEKIVWIVFIIKLVLIWIRNIDTQYLVCIYSAGNCKKNSILSSTVGASIFKHLYIIVHPLCVRDVLSKNWMNAWTILPLIILGILLLFKHYDMSGKKITCCVLLLRFECVRSITHTSYTSNTTFERGGTHLFASR